MYFVVYAFPARPTICILCWSPVVLSLHIRSSSATIICLNQVTVDIALQDGAPFQASGSTLVYLYILRF